MSHAADRLLQQTIAHLHLKLAQAEDRIRLLDSENEDLLRQLKDAGVEPRQPLMQAGRLSAPLAKPDEEAIRAAAARMTSAERRLYGEVCGGEQVLTVLQSTTRTGVGLWLIERRVWVVVTRGEVILLAAGRRPLAQRVAFPHLYASLYNAVTGELVLAPDRGYRVGRFQLPPAEGNRVLAQIYGALAPQDERRG
jgi:hypothetical protein